MTYQSSAEMAAHADEEGGITELIFGRGMELSELPDDIPNEIYEAIDQLINVKPRVEQISAYLDSKLAEGDW